MPAVKEAQEDETSNVLQLKPILEAEKKHGPIFRRELFDIAYKAYLSIDDDAPENKITGEESFLRGKCLRTKIPLVDIYGITREVRVFRDSYIGENFHGESCIMKRCWLYTDLQGLGRRHDDLDLYPPLSFTFGARQEYSQAEGNNPITADFHDKAMAFRTEWEASEIRRRLVIFLEQDAGQTQQVEQIICFALGPPVSSTYPGPLRRSYVQHLAACTVRDMFARKQNGTIPKIFTQDPEYKPVDIDYVSTHFSMTTLPDPEGFRALNGSTFVISIAPNVPVRQIALGMTHDDSGPAGFFCGAIHSDGLEGEGMSLDDIYSGDKPVYYTCNPSPALWQYKQKSMWVEFGDKKETDCFGDMGIYLKKAQGGTG